MNYLETLKNIAKDKKKENLIFLLILLVILLFSCTYIFNNNNKTKSVMSTNIKDENSKSTIEIETTNMEQKLGKILSEISGISDVSVALTYSNDGNNTPIYNTRETVNSSQTTTEKNVAYNEENGTKVAVIATKSLPTVEGAIVVAKGAESIEMKSKIANAVAISVGIPVHKVQVFEKE